MATEVMEQVVIAAVSHSETGLTERSGCHQMSTEMIDCLGFINYSCLTVPFMKIADYC